MSIYKYVVIGRIDILKNELIRFTHPEALNDPWEVKPYIQRLVNDDFFENLDIQQNGIIEMALEKIWEDKLSPIQKAVFSREMIRQSLFNSFRRRSPLLNL